MTLRDDLALDLDWETLKTSEPNVDALKTLCIECGFHRFLSELPAPQPAGEVQTWVADYRVVDTPELFGDFLTELKRQPRFCLDTETTDIDPLRASLVGIAVSWKAGLAYYLPLRGPIHCRVLDPHEVLEALRPILADPEVEKVGQNLKYDMLALGRAGVAIEGPITDTMILSYLLESGERNHNLDQLAQRLLGHTMIPITDLIGKGKKQGRMDQVEVARVATYAGEDADATWRIEEILAPRVKSQGLWKLYTEVERPLISILAGMEQVGVGVDTRRWASFRVSSPGGWQRSRTTSTGWLEGRSTSTPAPSSARCFSRSSSCPRCKRPPAASRAPPGGPRVAGRQAPAARLALAASPALEAQEYLSRCACRPWSIPRTGAFMPRSTRAWRPREG